MPQKRFVCNVESGHIPNVGGAALIAMGLGVWTRDEVDKVHVMSNPQWPAKTVYCVARNDWGSITVYISNYRSDVEAHFHGAGNRILCALYTNGEIEELASNWVMFARNPATEAGAISALKSIRENP